MSVTLLSGANHIDEMTDIRDIIVFDINGTNQQLLAEIEGGTLLGPGLSAGIRFRRNHPSEECESDILVFDLQDSSSCSSSAPSRP